MKKLFVITLAMLLLCCAAVGMAEEEAETVPLPEVYRTDLSGEEEEKHEDPTERLLGILKEMETECSIQALC